MILVKFLRRTYVRLAVLSSLAAALAYAFGAVIHAINPVVAAITALIAVRPTFHASLQEAFRQIIGVILGGLVAYGATITIGFSPITLFLAVVSSFTAAWLLKLGEAGAGAIGVTVILVLGPTVSTEAVSNRLLGVVVGSLLALLVSLYTRPGTPHSRALTEVIAESDKTSVLLTEIADLKTHSGHVGKSLANVWLIEAERILRRVAEIRKEAEDAIGGSRWSPLIEKQDAENVFQQVLLARGTALTVVNICRDLLTDADKTLPQELASSLSEVLQATAEVIDTQATLAQENPAETLEKEDESLETLVGAQKDATKRILDLEDTQPILLGGSLLRDTKKIREILSS
jgi:uncharacterized membrane protein YgaE (UPF0421/DUF939 family)